MFTIIWNIAWRAVFVWKWTPFDQCQYDYNAVKRVNKAFKTIKIVAFIFSSPKIDYTHKNNCGENYLRQNNSKLHFLLFYDNLANIFSINFCERVHEISTTKDTASKITESRAIVHWTCGWKSRLYEMTLSYSWKIHHAIWWKCVYFAYWIVFVVVVCWLFPPPIFPPIFVTIL